MSLQLYGGSQFEEAEVRNILRARADADEFDFRDDEAVAAAMFAHTPVELRQRSEIEYFSVTYFSTHPRVPAVKGHDEADDATPAIAGNGVLVVVLIVCDKVGAVLGSFCSHGNMVLVALTDFERIVDLGGIEISVYGCEVRFRLGLKSGLRDDWDRECGCADVEAEEFVKIGDGFDRFQIEAFPGLQIANIPPRVHLVTTSKDNIHLRNKMDRWIGPRQILCEVD